MMLVHPCKVVGLHTIFAHICRPIISPFPLLYPNTFEIDFSMVPLTMAKTILDVTDAADNLETGVFDKSKNTVVTFKASEDLYIEKIVHKNKHKCFRPRSRQAKITHNKRKIEEILCYEVRN
jgi:hypothetical protein